jgi:hypothetical protein
MHYIFGVCWRMKQTLKALSLVRFACFELLEVLDVRIHVNSVLLPLDAVVPPYSDYSGVLRGGMEKGLRYASTTSTVAMQVQYQNLNWILF